MGLKAYVPSLPSQLEVYVSEPFNNVLLQVEAAGLCQEMGNGNGKGQDFFQDLRISFLW